MAMVADAFAGKLIDILMDLVTEKVVRILGVKNDLQRLQKRLKTIKAVLSEAEHRRINDEPTKEWLSQLKDVMYDMDDVIDLCRVEGRSLIRGESRELLDITSSSVRTSRCRFPFFSLCFSATSSIPFRHEIGEEIQRINQKLKEISEDSMMSRLPQGGSSGSGGQGLAVAGVNRQTSPLPPSDFVGGKTEELARRLVDLLVKTEVEGLLVFAIAGLGGIGKTTLAKKIYNDEKVQNHFQKNCWVCVSQSYSEVELLKEAIRKVGGTYGQENTLSELQPLLKSSLEGKRFLLVLDDVWTTDVWEHLLQDPLRQTGKSCSRVLVTTRNEDVAKGMGARNQIHRVEKLPVEDGWALLCKIAFENETDEGMQNLREIGMQIVEKCDGLPLAIKAIAGVLKGKERKRSEWVKVHESQAWSVGGELPKDVRGALYLSYEDLPSQLKQCFLFCSFFPEDYIFYRCYLIQCWIAEGFVSAQGALLLEDIAEECYNSLISRNLLHFATIDGSECTMHDLTRSLAMFLSGDESYFVNANELTTIKVSKLRRLAIEDGEGSTGVLNAMENPCCLRTLHAVKCGQINAQDLLQRFTHLRILNLTGSMIESIPESIRNLHHLRYLDLDGTDVHELPESLGCLSNLQFLYLNGCGSLRTLPKAITQLCNLRYLGLMETPVGFLPSGIGQLRNLNDLQGFVVSDDGDNRDLQPGCHLNELQSMSNLRKLSICRLVRVQMGGLQPLKDKCHLKELNLEWSVDADRSLISHVAEEICESLSPSPSLETLTIHYFLGNRFPTWITTLNNLTSLHLDHCLSCQVLPPLGMLSQLKFLCIISAYSVVTVGLEFLGLDSKDGEKEELTAAFPRLEVLTMMHMNKWEGWEIDTKEIDGGRRTTIELLPRLRRLHLFACPKLRALPEGLRHVTSLKQCHLYGAKCLREINNIPSVEKLVIQSCRCVESISNLPALREFNIQDSCQMLRSVDKLSIPQKLVLVLLEDDWTECLPEWLLRFLQEAKVNGCLQQLNLRCNKPLKERCIKGGQYWPLLSHIPDFTVESY